jgi:nucleotide-binding universal stress UspA family protein
MEAALHGSWRDVSIVVPAMATIVCAVDDSAGASAALDAAKELAEALELRLVLAHVAQGYRVRGDDESLTGSQGRRGGTRLLERLAVESGLGGSVDQRVELGDAVEEIARIAREEAATIIVVGSRTRGRRRPKLLSSLASELAGTAPCPVFVVPSSGHR